MLTSCGKTPSGFKRTPAVASRRLLDFLAPRAVLVNPRRRPPLVDHTSVKVLAWYDNEIGYVNRMIELAQKVGNTLSTAA
jgi:hypothetical protein